MSSALEKLRRMKQEREARQANGTSETPPAPETPKVPEAPVAPPATQAPPSPPVAAPVVAPPVVAPEPPKAPEAPQTQTTEEAVPRELPEVPFTPDESAEDKPKRTRRTKSEMQGQGISIEDLKTAIREVLAEGNPCACAGTEQTVKAEEKNGKILVTQKYTKSGDIIKEDTDTELISVSPFATPTATISVGLSFTKNLGNYESCRSDVHVSIPTYIEEIDNAFEVARKMADSKLALLIGDDGK